LTSIFKGMEEL